MKKLNVSQENDNQVTEESVQTVTQETPSIVEDTIPEIDYELVSTGPLYFDPKHLKSGYVPAFVSDKPGEIEMYKRWGYEIVIDDFKVGQTHASTTSRFGSAVTVQSKCGQLLVLMVIKEEQHKKLMAFRQKKNNERNSALGKIEGVPEEFQELFGESIGEYKITRR